MALLLFMTYYDQVGTPRSPRYLRWPAMARWGPPDVPRCLRVANDGQAEGLQATSQWPTQSRWGPPGTPIASAVQAEASRVP